MVTWQRLLKVEGPAGSPSHFRHPCGSSVEFLHFLPGISGLHEREHGGSYQCFKGRVPKGQSITDQLSFKDRRSQPHFSVKEMSENVQPSFICYSYMLFPWNKMKSLIFFFFKQGLPCAKLCRKQHLFSWSSIPSTTPPCPHAQTPNPPLPVSLKPVLNKDETTLAFGDPFLLSCIFNWRMDVSLIKICVAP